MHGPQADHAEVSHSVGQGTWHSWEVLGRGPVHSLRSTGLEAVKTKYFSYVTGHDPQL